MGILRSLARFALVLLAAASVAQAQQYSYGEQSAPQYAEAGFTSAELDQMLAPVALYPDELLSQVLMAATYPLEVVEAARWSRANPDAQGEEAVQAVDAEDWDPSVKSLVAFPQVLDSMDQNLGWTQRLGEAFLANQDAVMASVQRLRRAAMEQGSLSSTDEMVVTRDGTEIALDSPSPDTMYVPYYDPRVVYGNWWWPGYPPVYWAPWPGYYVGSYGFGWGLGVPIGVDFFFADFDWRRHRVHVQHRPFYFHDRDHRPIHVRNGEWRWDPHHRRDVPFRNPVARQEFGGARVPREVRRPWSAQGAAPQLRQGEGVAAPRMPYSSQSAAPLARPAQPQSQGFFPQQPAPREVRPLTPRNEGARAVVPSPAMPRVYTPQAVQPQVVRPPVAAQPLARPSPVAPATPAVRSAPAPVVRSAPAPAVRSGPGPAPGPAPVQSAPARVQQGSGSRPAQGEGAREGPRDR